MDINFIDMSVTRFIQHIITFNNAEDILNIGKEPRDKGFIYERLWDIVIKLGFCSKFPNSKFIHKIGNADDCSLKNLININSYFNNEKVYSGNKHGKSDITLYNKDDDKYIFISSKFYQILGENGKNKAIDKYGISDIIAFASKNTHLYKNYDIYLVVNNKKLVLDKSNNANKSNEFITNEIKEANILDLYDLNKCFLLLKQDILKNLDINPELNFNELYLLPKDNLELRFHQEFITTKTSSLIEEGKKCFLWGCKCRSGKTYMTGGIILKQFDVKHKLNVLIITPAPTETIPQFTDGLFNNFRDFNKFKIQQIDGNNIKKLVLDTNNIFVMSKQFLQNYVNEYTIMTIKNLKLDIIIFDENHFSGTTDKSKLILNSYSTENTIKIYLTATYNKPLKEWLIPDECHMYWDIEDEQICKSIMNDETNINKLTVKHGDIITHTLKYYTTQKGYTLNDIFKPYLKMPDLCLITNLYDKDRYKKLKEEYMGSKYGFCFETLLSLNDTKTKFNFEPQVKTILRYISGSNKGKDFKFGDKSIFGRIHKLCSIKNTRTPFIQIWFLPSDNINEISLCLEKLMIEDTELIKYNIMCINRKNDNLPKKDIKDAINNIELKSRNDNKEGLILLVGNMLSLGITIESCDVVFLMNSTLSSDKVLQQMYRCMTEGENKQLGIVIDLNISRVLNTFMNYTIYNNELSPADKVKYLIDHHLINIDTDLMETKKLNSDSIVKELMDIWKDDPINSIKLLLRNLINDYEHYDNHIQKKLNSIFTKALNGETTISATVLLVSDDDDIENDIPSGIETKNIDKDGDNKEQTKKEEIIISFTKDVLPYIIPLTCILTIKNTNTDFVKMLNDIKDNKELLAIFDDQCLIWWNKKDLIDFIKSLVIKYFDKSSNTYKISVQIKTSMKQLIDNPTELLELINYSLRPKDIEKKQFGEVFTSMILVNEMLDKLPKEVWTNKDLKWFDPATGMGNFPIAVYLRLTETLKDIIINNDARKTHILENMLYMSELNKKNVLITKQIFDINNIYKLNVYEGDSLLLDTNKEWGIKYFDVIMGNPPYQKENKKNNTARGGTNNNLYLDFIYKSLTLLQNDGYLVFIHPLNWRKIGSDIFTEFINRNIYYLKLNYGGNYFDNVSVKTDYYILKNSSHKEFNTTIEYINNDVNVISHLILSNTLKFIPNIFNEHINSIFNKINLYGKKYECIISSDCHKTRPHVNKGKNNEFKYPLFNTSGNPYEYYSSKAHKNQNSKKIILSNSGKLSPFYDNGILGTTQDSMYILVNSEEEGNIIINTINSELFTFLIQICQWGNFRNEASLFTYFKYIDINIINQNTIDNEFLYKYFKMNDAEINFVENVISKTNKDKDIKKDKSNIYYQTIKHKRKHYYLIDNKVYNIQKNKLLGKIFGDYVNEKVIEIIPTNTINNIIHTQNTFNSLTKPLIQPFNNTSGNILINNIDNIDNTHLLTISKKGRLHYYLIENKLYKIKKDKTQGEYYCDYVNEVIKNTPIKSKRITTTKKIVLSLNEPFIEPVIEPLIEQQPIELFIEPLIEQIINQSIHIINIKKQIIIKKK